MEIRFNRDPDSELAHCYTQHSVSEREVIEVLRRPGDLFRRQDDTIAAEGQTNAGRYIRVIFRGDSDRGYTFVITAYELKGNAKQAYRRRHRR